MLEKVRQHVAIEPNLQPVTDNDLVPSTANANDDARLDVSAINFWIMDQKEFLTSGSLIPTIYYTSQKVLNSVFAVNEREKKRLYK